MLNKKSPFNEDTSISGLKNQLKSFNDFYNDSFGLKQPLLDSYYCFKLGLLNEFPYPNSTVKGKDGWFFLGNSYNNVLNDHFGLENISLTQLQDIKQTVSKYKTYLDQKGIPFFIVVPPDKHEVYEEFLPFSLPKKTNRLDKIEAYLYQELNFEIINLTDTLLSRKKDRQLYYKTDSHWNDYGAFIGYNFVMDRIKKTLNVEKTSIHNYNIVQGNNEDTHFKNDLMSQLRLPEQEEKLNLVKLDKSLVTLEYNSKGTLIYKNPEGTHKLLMFRDSFSNAWIQFFNESFETSMYTRSLSSLNELIEKEQPDVVIFELIERNLPIGLTE